MSSLKHKIQLASFVLFISLSHTVSAEKLTNTGTQESKNTNPVSDVNPDKNAKNHTTPSSTVTCTEAQHVSGQKQHQQIIKQRRQYARQALDAYKQYLQRRNQQTSANPYLSDDIKAMQLNYYKNMDARRELVHKMMEQRRREALSRRVNNQQKMHQTKHRTETVIERDASANS